MGQSRDKPKWKNAALWYQHYFGGSKLWFSVKTSSNKVFQSAKHFHFSDKIFVFLIIKIKAFSSRFNLAHFWCSIWAVSGQASYCWYSTILLWGPNLALLSAAALPYVDFWTFCKLVLNYLYCTQLRAIAMLWYIMPEFDTKVLQRFTSHADVWILDRNTLSSLLHYAVNSWTTSSGKHQVKISVNLQSFQCLWEGSLCAACALFVWGFFFFCVLWGCLCQASKNLTLPFIPLSAQKRAQLSVELHIKVSKIGLIKRTGGRIPAISHNFFLLRR